MPKARRLEEMTYQYMKEQIHSRQWLPQTHITEQALSKELNVSRTPIRQAFLRLEQEGYLTIEANRGAKINEPVITEKGFQERLEFIELLVVEYLHQLQIKEVKFDMAQLEQGLGKLVELDESSELQLFLNSEIAFWNMLLVHHRNMYTASLLMDTFRSIHYQKDPVIRSVLEETRSVKLEHYGKLLDFLNEQNYALARREIRILINQIMLVILQGA